MSDSGLNKNGVQVQVLCCIVRINARIPLNLGYDNVNDAFDLAGILCSAKKKRKVVGYF